MRMICSSLAILFLASLPLSAGEVNAPEGWTFHSPRKEIQPAYQYLPSGGPNGQGSFVIEADQREGLMGFWQKQIRVEPDQYYQFTVLRKTSELELARRTVPARILWRDAAGKSVYHEQPSAASYRPGTRPRSEPEFPADVKVLENGWTLVSGTYLTPPATATATIELCYRWEPNGRVEWSEMKLQKVDAPEPRKVRLATIHYQPRAGKTPKEKREQFAPLIEKAAQQHVDLIVLPETLTYYGTGSTYVDCAEPVPGPTTDYFGGLAMKHHMHIVVGMLERDEHLVYNVAVLVGPDGEVIGKYRKVTLPRGEIEGGITPGDDYPVFDTAIGKIGMMICYDGFFPEVARELSNRGAEIIAWPVWGCNPLLGSARACENHVYVISSTYTDVSNDWMISAVYNHDGRPLAQGKEWGDVAIAEVDLNQPLHWQSLGDFRAQIQRHRPVVPEPAK